MRRVEAFHGELQSGMRFADLHIHGVEDDGRLSTERMVTSALRRGLDAIGVTLHDNYPFAEKVYNYVERNNLPLRVYPGSEVTAKDEDGNDAHILVYETGDDIQMYQSISDTLEDVEKRGGFAIIPHPDSAVGGSAKMEEILKLGALVHIEVFNAGVRDMHILNLLLLRKSVDSNKTTRDIYEANKAQLGGATGSTDVHKFKVGLGMTAYEGDLRQALKEKRTVVVFRREIELWFPWDVRIHDRKVEILDEWRRVRYNEEENMRRTQFEQDVFEEVA